MFIDWLLTYTLHSSLLLGLALGMRLALQERRLALQEIVVRTAILGGFLTASLQVGLGVKPVFGSLRIESASAITSAGGDQEPASPSRARLVVDGAHGQESPAARERGMAPTTTREEPRRADPGGSSLPRPTASGRPADALVVPGEASPTRAKEHRVEARSVPVSMGSDTVSPAAAAAESGPPSPWPHRWSSRALLLAGRLVAVAWAALLVVGLLRMVSSALRLHRLLSDRQPAQGEALQRSFDALCARLGLAGIPRLTVSRRLPIPIARGVLEPEVCVPERVVQTLPAAEQEALFAHELAHHARRDPFWLLVTQTAVTVGALQPMNLWARRRLSDLAECLSDDLAVEASGSSVGLARSLVGVAAWTMGMEPLLSATTAGALRTKSRLALRVERIMNPARVQSVHRRLLVSGALIAVAAVAFLVPGVSRGASAIPGSLEEARMVRPSPPEAPSADVPEMPAVTPSALPVPESLPEEAPPTTPKPGKAPAVASTPTAPSVRAQIAAVRASEAPAPAPAPVVPPALAPRPPAPRSSAKPVPAVAPVVAPAPVRKAPKPPAPLVAPPSSPPSEDGEDATDMLEGLSTEMATEAWETERRELERELEGLESEMASKARSLAELRVKELEHLTSESGVLREADAKRLADEARLTAQKDVAAMVKAGRLTREDQASAAEVAAAARKMAADILRQTRIAEREAMRASKDAQAALHEGQGGASMELQEVRRLATEEQKAALEELTRARGEMQRAIDEVKRALEGIHSAADALERSKTTKR